MEESTESRIDFEFLVDYLEKIGIKVTIDTTPNEEKIAYIKKQIEKMRIRGL